LFVVRAFVLLKVEAHAYEQNTEKWIFVIAFFVFSVHSTSLKKALSK